MQQIHWLACMQWRGCTPQRSGVCVCVRQCLIQRSMSWKACLLITLHPQAEICAPRPSPLLGMRRVFRRTGSPRTLRGGEVAVKSLLRIPLSGPRKTCGFRANLDAVHGRRALREALRPREGPQHGDCMAAMREVTAVMNAGARLRRPADVTAGVLHARRSGLAWTIFRMRPCSHVLGGCRVWRSSGSRKLAGRPGQRLPAGCPLAAAACAVKPLYMHPQMVKAALTAEPSIAIAAAEIAQRAIPRARLFLNL